ncbi:hypothetical protein RhiJN_06155 [Ceratobasidium sp. AG-Ba]|nr:hypothetical protein RhiJN_06155 [Ceratobasidium sp. AG-Ba]QRW07103.1 hypothetical protein RhiLY_06102 [Ceratobasidium sp. AG-Ba]
MLELPPEIIQLVAGHSHEPFSLLLVNKYFYRNLVSILYHNIYLEGEPKTLDLYETLLHRRPDLRRHVRILHIYSAPHASPTEIESHGRLAKCLLLLTPNLVNLSLGFSQQCIDLILADETSPFSLLRLSVPGISVGVLGALLQAHKQIELLDIREQQYGGERTFPQTFQLPADILPSLKSARTLPISVHMQKHPHITSHGFKETEIPHLIDTMSGCAARLVNLRLDLHFNPTDWHTQIPALMSKIDFSQDSLQTLSLSFSPDPAAARPRVDFTRPRLGWLRWGVADLPGLNQASPALIQADWLKVCTKPSRSPTTH